MSGAESTRWVITFIPVRRNCSWIELRVGPAVFEQEDAKRSGQVGLPASPEFGFSSFGDALEAYWP